MSLVEVDMWPEPTGGVYFLADTVCGIVKVGMSQTNVERRVGSLQTASPHDLNLLAVVWTLAPARLETDLHWALRGHRVRGEWFNWSDKAPGIVERVITAHLLEAPACRVEGAERIGLRRSWSHG